ncbi:hypothetical protein KY343_01850 [Candidatus Woesearchaeota archaeon]|nr:hypothetical protein [Candidatus Woesearchaeota archaeon]
MKPKTIQQQIEYLHQKIIKEGKIVRHAKGIIEIEDPKSGDKETFTLEQLTEKAAAEAPSLWKRLWKPVAAAAGFLALAYYLVAGGSPDWKTKDTYDILPFKIETKEEVPRSLIRNPNVPWSEIESNLTDRRMPKETGHKVSLFLPSYSGEERLTITPNNFNMEDKRFLPDVPKDKKNREFIPHLFRLGYGGKIGIQISDYKNLEDVLLQLFLGETEEHDIIRTDKIVKRDGVYSTYREISSKSLDDENIYELEIRTSDPHGPISITRIPVFNKGHCRNELYVREALVIPNIFDTRGRDPEKLRHHLDLSVDVMDTAENVEKYPDQNERAYVEIEIPALNFKQYTLRFVGKEEDNRFKSGDPNHNYYTLITRLKLHLPANAPQGHYKMIVGARPSQRESNDILKEVMPNVVGREFTIYKNKHGVPVSFDRFNQFFLKELEEANPGVEALDEIVSTACEETVVLSTMIEGKEHGLRFKLGDKNHYLHVSRIIEKGEGKGILYMNVRIDNCEDPILVVRDKTTEIKIRDRNYKISIIDDSTHYRDDDLKKHYLPTIMIQSAISAKLQEAGRALIEQMKEGDMPNRPKTETQSKKTPEPAKTQPLPNNGTKVKDPLDVGYLNPKLLNALYES